VKYHSTENAAKATKKYAAKVPAPKKKARQEEKEEAQVNKALLVTKKATKSRIGKRVVKTATKSQSRPTQKLHQERRECRTWRKSGKKKKGDLWVGQ